MYGQEKDASVTSSCRKGLIHCMSNLPGFLCLMSGQSAGLFKRPILERDRKCTYKCNIQVRQGNKSCRGKAICITYSECVSVVLVIQYVVHMPVLYCRHLGPVPLYRTFPRLIIDMIFRKKKEYRTQNVSFDFLYNFCLKHFLF